MPIYSKHKPKKAGHYWVKDASLNRETIRRFIPGSEETESEIKQEKWTYFCGPIERPKFVSTEEVVQNLRTRICKVADLRRFLERNPELALLLQEALK